MKRGGLTLLEVAVAASLMVVLGTVLVALLSLGRRIYLSGAARSGNFTAAPKIFPAGRARAETGALDVEGWWVDVYVAR